MAPLTGGRSGSELRTRLDVVGREGTVQRGDALLTPRWLLAKTSGNPAAARAPPSSTDARTALDKGAEGIGSGEFRHYDRRYATNSHILARPRTSKQQR
jgi:hypothetical protein